MLGGILEVHSFLLLSNILLYESDTILFTHSPVVHLEGSKIGVITNKATVNTLV